MGKRIVPDSDDDLPRRVRSMTDSSLSATTAPSRAVLKTGDQPVAPTIATVAGYALSVLREITKGVEKAKAERDRAERAYVAAEAAARRDGAPLIAAIIALGAEIPQGISELFITCGKAGCGKSFTTRQALGSHLGKIHEKPVVATSEAAG